MLISTWKRYSPLFISKGWLSVVHLQPVRAGTNAVALAHALQIWFRRPSNHRTSDEEEARGEHAERTLDG